MTEPRTLHEALGLLAAATAEPGGAGPRLAVRTGSAVPKVTAGAATLFLGTEYARALAEAGPAGLACLGLRVEARHRLPGSDLLRPGCGTAAPG